MFGSFFLIPAPKGISLRRLVKFCQVLLMLLLQTEKLGYLEKCDCLDKYISEYTSITI